MIPLERTLLIQCWPINIRNMRICQEKIREMRSSSEILDHIMDLKNIRTDAKLSELFHVAPTTVNSWRTRNALPYERIFKFCEEEGFSLYHVFYGEGPKYRGDRTTESDCLRFFILEAMRDSGITLTPHGLQKMMDLVHEEVWKEMKTSVVEALKALTGIMPSWKEDTSKQGEDD